MRLRRRGTSAARPLAAVALAAAALAGGAHATGVLERAENETIDARFVLRGAEPVPDVAVIAIDDVTFGELRERWPFSRRRHARAIARLRAAGVRTVAYDVQFTEESQDADADAALYDAVAATPGTVLSTTESDGRGGTAVLGGEPNLRAARARAADTRVATSAGGVVRRVSHTVDGLESFAVAAVESATGRQVNRATFGARGALIDFHGPPGTVPTYSFSALLDGRVPAARLRDRIVVVGATAPSLQDLHAVPTSGDSVMPGPELQANAISTVLRGVPLRPVPGWVDLLATLALALAVPLAALRLRPRAVAVLAGVALAGWLAAGQLAFDAGRVLAVAAPLLGLVLGTVGAIGAAAITAGRARRRTRALFERFAPETVVRELLGRADGEAGLGGARQDATVLFCDLRGFTTFAEQVTPELVIEVLNRYLTEVSDAVLEHGGTVVSYLGDGVMAVFGAPVERADHAGAALGAAEEVLAVRLPRLNAWLVERGLDPFALGAGLHSGPVMSGTVGSQRRMEYAAVGDTTNVAARLQAATKGTPHPLFASGATFQRLDPDAQGRLRSAGELELSGRREPVRVWALPAEAGALADAA